MKKSNILILTGHSPVMSEIRRLIRQVARHPDVRVLILGESGAGKEAEVNGG